MCFIHKWMYFGKNLRTCTKCGVHQHHTSFCEDYSRWDNIRCDKFEKRILKWKVSQCKHENKKRKEIEKVKECKLFDHAVTTKQMDHLITSSIEKTEKDLRDLQTSSIVLAFVIIIITFLLFIVGG